MKTKIGDFVKKRKLVDPLVCNKRKTITPNRQKRWPARYFRICRNKTARIGGGKDVKIYLTFFRRNR